MRSKGLIGVFVFLLIALATAVFSVTVSISPQTPTADNSLTCLVGGSPVGVNAHWTSTGFAGEKIINPLSSVFTKAGDVVTCNAWIPVYDGSYYAGSATVTVGAGNTPPDIVNLPDFVWNESTGPYDNVTDLWNYTSDAQTPVNQLVFSITDQSRSDIVNCVIDSNRYIDCTLVPGMWGTSFVTVRVSDGLLTDQDVFQIDIISMNSVPGVAIVSPLNGDGFVNACGVVNFDVNATDSDGTIVSYNWIYNGNNIGNSPTFSLNANQFAVGSNTVAVTVSDDDGGQASDSVTFSTTAHTPPSILITQPVYDPVDGFYYQYNEGVNITFDSVANSTDGCGNNISYLWTNNGMPIITTGSGFSRNNLSVGQHEIRVYATDEYSNVSYDRIFIEILDIANSAPAVTIDSPLNGDSYVKQCNNINFTASYTDAENDLIISWLWIDGILNIGNTQGFLLNANNFSIGNHTIGVYATDDGGVFNTDPSMTGNANVNFEIRNHAGPTLNINSPVFSGVYDDNTLISFDASALDNECNSSIFTWIWQSDGNQIGNNQSFSDILNLGVHNITVYSTDQYLGVGFDSETINVTEWNTPPAINSMVCTNSTGGLPLMELEDIVCNANVTDNTGSIVSYVWDVVEDSTSQQSSGNTFVLPELLPNGTYTVSLIVTDNGHLDSLGNMVHQMSSSANISINVINNPPIVTLTPLSLLAGNEPLNTSFRCDVSGGNPLYNYTFDPGDGSGLQTQIGGSSIMFNKIYVQDGIFNATCGVVDSDGDFGSGMQTVVVNDLAPVANFSFVPLTGFEGDTINFTDLSTAYDSPILAWYWDFGDGNTSNLRNPSHVYTQVGPGGVTYTVSLTVVDSDGPLTNNTISRTIFIDDTIPSFVDAGPNQTVMEGSTITLIGSATAYDGISSWDWNFGDGNTGNGQSVTHVYVQDGTYTVTLTVTDGDGSAVSDTMTVFVLDSVPGNVSAGADQNVLEGVFVNFNGSAAAYDQPIIYNWNFGDGNSAVGQNVTNQYGDIPPTNQVYVVILNVTDADGSSATDTMFVNVNDGVPVANAGVDQNVIEGQVVNFDGSGSVQGSIYDPIVNYSWNFGDGNNATGVNPTNTYLQDGVYNVILTVTDDDGSVNSDTMIVVVNDTNPVASFTYFPPVNNEGDMINFTDASTSYDGVVSWLWNFGDGNTSASQNISHSFALNGSYNVSLTITEADGDSDIFVNTVVIGDDIPVVTLIAVPTTGSEPLTVNFTCSVSGGNPPYVFDFDFIAGTTTTSTTSISQIYTYNDNGTYVPVCTVTDADADADNMTQTIAVNDVNPTANLIPNSSVIDEGSSVLLNASASTSGSSSDLINYYLFNFGDNITYVESVGSAPDGSFDGVTTHVYSDQGSYTVTLIVSDEDSVDQTSAVITVNDVSPSVRFSFSPEPSNEGSSVTFDASNTTGNVYDVITSYVWDFGDSSNGTGVIASHTYNDNGAYTVTLTVNDEDSFNSTSLTANVNNINPTANANGPYNGVEGVALWFNGTGTDASSVDEPLLNYYWDFSYDGIAFNVDAIGQNATNTYPDDFSGSVALNVTDKDGGSSLSVTSVNIINANPVVNITSPILLVEDTVSNIDFSSFVSDVPADTIIWSVSGNSNIAISFAGGIVTFTPNLNWVGNETVLFTATDDDAGSSSQSVILSVGNVNDAPNITSAPVLVGIEDSAYSYDADAVDLDLDNLTYSLTVNPVGMTIDATTGVISWTPNNTQVGNNAVAVQVSDGVLTDTQLFTINVANVVPVITSSPNLTATEGVLYTYDVESTDEGQNSLYSLILGPSGLAIDINSGLITWTPTGAQLGSNLVALQVNDNNGGLDFQSFVVNVTGAANVVINEFLAQPASDWNGDGSVTTADEYIELYNLGGTLQDLTGWTITEGSGAITSLSGTLSPGAFLLIMDPNGVLNDVSTETITLFDNFGAIVDVYSYTGSNPNVSVGRLPNGIGSFSDNTPTPGLPNVGLGNSAPTAVISTPVDGYNTTTGSAVIFGGSATDPEDGAIPWGSLAWSSNTSGVLGIGNVLSATLSQGTHIITLTAIDSLNATGVDTIVVNVNPAGNNVPVVTIFSPSAGNYTQGSSINFVGTAIDTEDLDISSSLQWYSDVDGNIGSGPSFIFNGLALGPHIITANVTDSGGLVGGATINLNINLVGNNPPSITFIDVVPSTAGQNSVLACVTATTDPDSDPVTIYYSWNSSGISDLSSFNTAILDLSLVPDEANGDIIYCTATPNDGIINGSSQFDFATLNISAINNAPIADAGADQNVLTGLLVTLNGSGSFDIDGDPLTYSWMQISGPAVSLTGNATVNPIFTPAVDGSYVFSLVVNDGLVNSIPDYVTIISNISVVNNAPIANAGPDQNVTTGTLVTLDGSLSSDPDSDPITYNWTQIAGSSVTLSDNTAVNPTFTSLADGTYIFQLVVNDGSLSSSPDFVTIISSSTANNAPVANAGPDQNVNTSSLVTLDGSLSSDPDSDPITYNWTQVAGPAVTLSDNTVVNPTFTPAVAGSYIFGLVVNDGILNSLPDFVVISASSVGNNPPSATIFSPSAGNYTQGTNINFIGSATDPEDGVLTGSSLQWVSSINGVLGTGASLTNSTLSVGTHVINFIATDSGGLSDNPSVTINIITSSVPSSTIINSWIDGVYYSSLITNSIPQLNASVITNSIVNLTNSLITISTINNAIIGANSIITNCIITNTTFNGGVCNDMVIDPSDIRNSVITGGGDVTDSHIYDSNIQGGNIATSSLDDVNILNADVTSSILNNVNIQGSIKSIITNSTLYDVTVTNAVIINDQLISGNVTLSNSTILTGPFDLNLVFTNNAPSAAASDVAGEVNTLFTLDGSGSSDPDSNPLTYRWTQVSGMPLISLSSDTSDKPTFTPTSTGVYIFQLIVSDGSLNSLPVVVDVNVQSASSTPPGPTGGGGGGSSSGGSSGVCGDIGELSSKTIDTREGCIIKFSYSDIYYSVKMIDATNEYLDVVLYDSENNPLDSGTAKLGDEARLNLATKNLVVGYDSVDFGDLTVSLSIEDKPLEVGGPSTEESNSAEESKQTSEMQSENENGITGAVVAGPGKGIIDPIGVGITLAIVIIGLGGYLLFTREKKLI